jgi:NTP pyrophosphatase (non-canonical NTP hydrolase)
MNIKEIQNRLALFAKEREWEQFHTSKNLATALSVEASELLEIFQWLSDDQTKNLSDKQMAMVREEIADVAIYMLRLADVVDIDLNKAINDKIKLNKTKYPIELSKGSSDKYNRRDINQEAKGK